MFHGETAVSPAAVDDERQALNALADNDVFPYLDERNAAIETGPTTTNVNDLRIFVVELSE